MHVAHRCPSLSFGHGCRGAAPPTHWGVQGPAPWRTRLCQQRLKCCRHPRPCHQKRSHITLGDTPRRRLCLVCNVHCLAGLSLLFEARVRLSLPGPCVASPTATPGTLPWRLLSPSLSIAPGVISPLLGETRRQRPVPSCGVGCVFHDVRSCGVMRMFLGALPRPLGL